MTIGRPTKLTPERQEQLIGYIAGGLYKETAAALAGISKSTLYNWLARGEEGRRPPINPDDYTRPELVDLAHDRGITDLPTRATKTQLAELINTSTDPYVDFLDAVKEAEARAEAYAIQQMHTVGRDDWRMWMTYLERTRPDKYGRRPAPEETDTAWVGDEQEAETMVNRGREIRIAVAGKPPIPIERQTG